MSGTCTLFDHIKYASSGLVATKTINSSLSLSDCLENIRDLSEFLIEVVEDLGAR